MHNRKDIDNIVYDILRKSKSLDVFPTPVDHIVQFCELNLGNSDYFHRIPKNYLAKNIDIFNRMLSKISGVLDREIKHIYIDPSLPDLKEILSNFMKPVTTAYRGKSIFATLIMN